MNRQLFKLQSTALFLFLSLMISPAYSSIPDDVMKAAQNGDADAQYSVGRLYQLGKRVKSDKNKALEWYNKAAAQGHLEANYRLGLLYYKGSGGYVIDFKEAFRYMSTAAKGNHKRSQTHLAQMYENGDGVRRSEELSDYWYEQSYNTNLQSLTSYRKSKSSTAVVKPPVVTAVPKAASKPTPLPRAVSKPKNEVVIRREVISFPATLLSYNWSRKGKPSVLVQSPSSRCKLKAEKIVCNSEKINALHPTGPYRYKIKSILTQAGSERDMKIVYRKLYVSVPEESIGGYDDIGESDASNNNRLTIGWEKTSHTIPCRFESSRSILCRPVGEDAFYLRVM